MCCSRPIGLPDDQLFVELSLLIEGARGTAAHAVDSELVMLYWSVGDRVRKDVLLEKRAEHGKRIVARLADKLTARYGRGYEYSALTRMLRVAEVFADRRIVVTLSRRLGWSHLVRLAAIEDRVEREFYTLMASRERWSVRTMRTQIDGGLYLRTISATRPVNSLETELAALRETGLSTPDLVLRDPHVLEFLGLAERHTDSDLEQVEPIDPLS